MYTTVLDHIFGWINAKTTYLICRMNSNVRPIMLKNTGRRHAELILMEKLERMDKSLMTTITIYITNSPCSFMEHSCARMLIEFLNKNPNVIIILYVTNLYNIRRMSCICEPHYTTVSQDNHEANLTGIKDLMEHNRCVVSAFSYAVWFELLNNVPVSKELKFELLDGYKTKLDKNDRSREEEDNRIRSDLVCIRCIPSVFQQQIKF